MAQSEYAPGSTRIGFVGLGLMGEPMARNLLSAGYTLQVHNRSRPAVDRTVRAGAHETSSPAEAAEGADLVILMLPDSPDVEAVVEGDDGVATTMRAGSVLVDMSTISPLVTRRLAATLAEQGVDMLDAPVSGGQKGAIDGGLTIMVGGHEDRFAACRPVFDVLGGSVTHIGQHGAGQVAKACNQAIVAGTIQVVGEALTLAAHSGVDPATVREALLGGFAGSKILEAHGQRMLSDEFEPGFKVRLHNKDLKIALEAASDSGVPLLTTAVVKQLLEALVARGEGDADHAALAVLTRQLAGDDHQR